MFFFISGYGLLSSAILQGTRYFDTFLSKRFGSLLKPYLVCIVIYQIFSYCIGEFPLSLHQIVQDLRVGNTHSFFPAWFVPAILYLYFSFFVSFRLLSRKTGSGIAVCVLLSLVYVAFTKELMNWGWHWWISTLAFNAGMIWKYYEVEILNIMNWWITDVATLALLFVSYYGMRSYCHSGLPLDWVAGLFLSVLKSVLATFLVYHICLPKWKPLVYLGSISYEIYLCQAIFYVLLRGHSLKVQPDWLYIALTITFTLLLAAGLHWSLGKLLKR